MKVKAISLYQPWASYIANGHKTIETRSWYTSYRGDLVICSSKRPAIKGLPAGKALAIAELFDCRAMRYEDADAAMCPWEYGRFSWLLRNVRKIDHPFSVRGRQGIYEIEIDLRQTEQSMFDARNKRFL